jgi:hypothetical protein
MKKAPLALVRLEPRSNCSTGCYPEGQVLREGPLSPPGGRWDAVAEVTANHLGGRASRRLEDPINGRRHRQLRHLAPFRGGGASAAGSVREDKEGTQPERRTGHRCHGGCLGVCLSEGTGTLLHVETFPG